MRTLKVQSSMMAGADVFDWQTFLKTKGQLHGNPDGLFGNASDQATKAYQTQAGLSSDGAVGSGTMAKAVDDGYVSTCGANIWGFDASANTAALASQLPGAGMSFAARYYSAGSSKNLTVAEAQALSAAGIQIVAVYEDSNDAVGHFSASTGTAQANRALQLAAEIGQPAGSAIYFAVDYDATQADVNGPITQYFQAVKAAFDGAGTQYRIGVYGGGMVCQAIQQAGLAELTWLAQSTGFPGYLSFRPNANIVQLWPSRTILNGHLGVDDDIAQTEDFGAFTV